MKLPCRLKEQYVLLSNDGPYRNVLKFKSPLVFGMEDARELVEKLDAVMTEMEAAEVKLLMTIPFEIQRYYVMGIILFFIIISHYYRDRDFKFMLLSLTCIPLHLLSNIKPPKVDIKKV